MSSFKISITPYTLELRDVFRISRSSRASIENIFLSIEKDGFTGYGEAGPNSRYGEDPAKVTNYLNQISGILDHINEPKQISDAVSTEEKRTATSPVYSARLALEMAWLDWWAKSQDKPLSELLGISQNETPVTSYTIGIDELTVMQKKIRDAHEYPVYKVKLGTDHDRKLVSGIRDVTDHAIRVDANEGWKSLDQAKREIEFLKDHNIEMIEQPMPADRISDLKKLKEWSPIPLCADESFTGKEEMSSIASMFNIVNIKLNKTGSVLKSLNALQQAKENGLQVMIGCMIESSLAISAGALVALQADHADLDGHLLISNDPFCGLTLNNEFGLRMSDGPGFGVTPNELMIF